MADSENYAIRKIVISSGAVTTLPPTGSSFTPNSVITDGTNLYVSGGYTLYKIVIATSTATAIAGTEGISGSADGIGSLARFSVSGGIDIDGTNLYVADTNNRTIRKIVLATNAVTTIAGTPGTTDATGSAAGFYNPVSTTTDGNNIYVTDTTNHTVRKIVIDTKVVTTFAGTANMSGSTDGIGAAARFNGPRGITTDGTYLYVADSYSSKIRKIVLATGAVTTIAITANGTEPANFSFICGMTTDSAILYLVDCSESIVRKIVLATGVVSTLAGTAGLSGGSDGIGAAASFKFPQGITTDGTNLYVADTTNHTIRQIVIATGAVTTLAGTVNLSGTTDGSGALARFHFPDSLTTDGTNLYVADTSNNTIRRIVIATGTVTTLAGSATVSGSADGIGTAASFNSPTDLTTNGFELFVVDSLNTTIRKIH
ncbi:MAG: hypothetical protein EOP51_31410 [Sphingobacteriales bacterium]|nr:MAG: hypothetical protein EOP51_31410 [Sphingobacteriales bacterium]